MTVTDVPEKALSSTLVFSNFRNSMAPSSTVLYANFIIQQLNIYVALFIYISGIVGALLNIVTFTSLNTFRQTSCGFYLTVTSVFNLGQTVFALSTRILDSGFAINLTHVSWACKCRTYLAQSCVLLSLTSMSLVTIDQFFSLTRFRRWSSLRLARRHILVACSIWLIHGISAVIFWDAPFGVCMTFNAGYRRYISSFYLPVLLGGLPICVMGIFASLSFYKIRTTMGREMNVVRLSHQRQLTAMALSQVLLIVLVSIPYTIFNIFDLNTVLTSPEDTAWHRLMSTVMVLLYYEHFAVSENSISALGHRLFQSPFYVFCCVSRRFRKQLVHVMIGIHVHRMQRLGVTLQKKNQIVPGSNVSFSSPHQKADVTITDIALQRI